MKKTYALVGTGGRSWMYTSALLRDFREHGELLAFCDVNQHRMDFNNRLIREQFGRGPLPTYLAHEFDRMVAETKPQTVIVTSIDRTHHRYICRAMELGCDAITEKPMTIDAEKCRRIVDTVKRTGRHLTVTFNYRYAPRNTKVKEILRSGILGNVISVHFEWLLDTSHGADYFRRWHRDKRNSGGLLVHKATHHFDLVNWWLDARPETVYARGDLRFYGRENAEERGVTRFYSRARDNAAAAEDPFALKVREGDTRMLGLYYDAEQEDGYYRDQSVFGDGISIEDTMSVMVAYNNRAVMTYSLNAFCPWEGYRICFNGSRGRLEFNVVETSHVAKGQPEDFTIPGMRELGNDKKSLLPQILFQPIWGKPQVIEYDEGDRGGHGGGDARLLRDLFVGVQDNSLGHAAGYVDGANSVLTGIAANLSMRTGLPVHVRDLVQGIGDPAPQASL
ncbi:MAG: Gfo/Idh/MocA family oxidoreductase [Lentisphaeria bacterium]|nr:Gfo/Idh/MocA family oxidoreductase [Lentisphaeria bacterium]